jgi:hypothetical protein
MPEYIIFDAEGKYSNCIVCDEWDVPPDGCTKQLIPEYHYWDKEKQEIIRDPAAPITIESV